jgi:hypothetical protein
MFESFGYGKFGFPGSLPIFRADLLLKFLWHDANSQIADCPEREATYIITTGGINDPDKA